MVKNAPANAGDIRDVGSIPGSGGSPGGGKGYPPQYSGLENSMDYIVHGCQRVGHDSATLKKKKKGGSCLDLGTPIKLED